MYWDGLVSDGNPPDRAILIASDFSPGIDILLERLNQIEDSEGNQYNFEKRTWKEEGIDYPAN